MAAPTHLQVSWRIDAEEGPDAWKRGIPVAMRALEIRLQRDRLVAGEAPPMPAYGVEGYIDGPYRMLVAYDPFPIIGVADEPDEDGETAYIYGPPCWVARVDTLARPA